jgi:hypothetical protein
MQKISRLFITMFAETEGAPQKLVFEALNLMLECNCNPPASAPVKEGAIHRLL